MLQSDKCKTGRYKWSWKALFPDKNYGKKKSDVKEILTRLYNQKFTESGSPDGKSENGISVEDAKLMKLLEGGAKMVNKNDQIPLPFRNANIQLPNSRY